MTPLLTLLFGFSPATAVGTDRLRRHHQEFRHAGAPRPRPCALAGGAPPVPGSLPAAAATILVLKSAGELDAGWLHAIRVTIGVSVLLTVASLLLRKQMLVRLERDPRFQLEGRTQAVATVVVGALLGVLVTVSSIGAGAVGATLILLLYPA